MFKFLPILYLFAGENVWARSIKATADRLGKEVIAIGMSVGLIGIAVAGIMLALGKQDGGPKLTQGFFGLLVVAGATSIVSFVQGVV